MSNIERSLQLLIGNGDVSLVTKTSRTGRKTIDNHSITVQDYNRWRWWRSGLECSPRKRKVGCSNPSREVVKKTQEVTAPTPNACESHGSSEMTIINGWPLSQFAALHRQCRRLQIIEKFSSRTKNLIQTNKHTYILRLENWCCSRCIHYFKNSPSIKSSQSFIFLCML